MKKYHLLWIIIILVVGIISIKAVLTPTQDTLTIGVVYPGSGSLAKHGEWMQRGIILAEKELKNQGITNLKLIYENTECDNTKFKTAIEKLVAIDNIQAYIGPFCGGEITLAAQASNQHKVIGLTPSTNFGKQSDYFFSTQATIQKESTYLAKALYDRGLRKIAIYYFNNDFGLAHRNAFTETFEAQGGKIVGTAMINSFAQTDYRSDILKLKSTSPEAIFIAYSNPAIVKQIRELDSRIQIVSTYGMESPELLALGRVAEGVMYSYRIPEPAKQTDVQKNFAASYHSEYGESAVLTATDSYDALKLLAQAFQACSDVRDQIECAQDKLSTTTRYPGAGGTMTIDPVTHEIDKPILLKTVRDGKFVELVN